MTSTTTLVPLNPITPSAQAEPPAGSDLGSRVPRPSSPPTSDQGPVMKLTATASAPERRNADGRILPTDTYTHESSFLWKSKIYNFTLHIPSTTPDVEGAAKTALDTAIELYKKKFIEHLKEEETKQPILKSDQGFDIEFTQKGYTLQTVKSKETATVITPEAKAFSALLLTGEGATYITKLLQNNDNYPAAPQVLTAPTTAPATQTPSPAAPQSTATASTNATQILPPAIKHVNNSCFAASILWYLHNDQQILKALPEAIKKAEPAKKDVLNVLHDCLTQMMSKKSIDAKTITQFRDVLFKFDPAIKMSDKQEGDAVNAIPALEQLILGNGRPSFAALLDDKTKAPIQPLDKTIQGVLGTTIPDAFNIDLDAGKHNIPLSVTVSGSTYKLCKALCHYPKISHYNVLVAPDKETSYSLCDDLKGTSKINDSNLKELLSKNAVKLLYVKQTPAKPVAATAPLGPVMLRKGKDLLVTKLLKKDMGAEKKPTVKDKNKNAEWQINDDREISDPIWSDLKAHIALIIADSGKGVITLTSTQKNIDALRLYVTKLVTLSCKQEQEIKNEHISFITEKGTRSLTSSQGEKTFNRQKITQLYTSLMNDPNQNGLYFDLRSEKALKSQSNEQTTLDNLLTVIRNIPPNGNKVHFMISADILIKNFDKITAAIKSAEDAYNALPLNRVKHVLWSVAQGFARMTGYPVKK